MVKIMEIPIEELNFDMYPIYELERKHDGEG
jgi:hypothetical protein